MFPNISVDSIQLSALLGKVKGFVENPPTDMFRRFQALARQNAVSMFQTLRFGGTHRGVTWKDFKNRATRGSRGGRRPSGALMSPRDNLMQDTGRLMQRTGRDWIFTAKGPGETIQSISPQLSTNVQYAEKQFGLRPALFWIDADTKPVAAIAVAHLTAAMR